MFQLHAKFGIDWLNVGRKTLLLNATIFQILVEEV